MCLFNLIFFCIYTECFSKKEESWNISSSSNQSSIDSDSEIELINDSESELEIECDLWDDDCKIITITSEKVLSGCKS